MNKLSVFLVLCTGLTATISLAQVPSSSLRRDLASMGSPTPTATASVFDAAAPAKKKSAGLAALYSLVLPGAGEWYADGLDAAKYPLIAEAALWLTYGTMEYYGGWLRDDARTFAVSHAGVSSTNMSDQFFVDVSNFSNQYDYNDKKLRDRSLDLVYTGSQYAWQWDTDANRLAFKDERLKSDRVFNNAKFVIGGMIVNRIVSVINAMRLTRRFNRSLESGGLGSWRIESSTLGAMKGVQVSLVRTF